MFLFIIAERGSFMDEKLKRIEAELKKLGINTVDDLNKAIKNQEKLDLSLMVSQLPEKERIAG
jgi:ribosome assembly protein YihI (activator of Der GTPase)